MDARRIAIIVPILALGIGAASPVARPADDIAKVGQIIQRSKETSATYALYMWNRISLPGREPAGEWSAEFHAGDLHRVETPRDRVVADCRALTGAALSLVTGEVVTGQRVAGEACGINTGRAFLGAEYLGKVMNRFGDADRVRLTDADNIRTYDVSADGILLRSVYADKAPGHRILLETQTSGLERKLPAGDIFSRESLQKSFVPDGYKSAPRPLI